MMIQLIINADDLGLSKAVNNGIIQAHREGILTSATIMANMPFFNEAVNLAKRHSDLGIGIHLNIVRGTPLSDSMKVPTLIDSNQLFFNKISKFAFKLNSGQIKLDEIRAEYKEQIERVIESCLKPTHIDSEKHHHLLPKILPLVTELAKYYNIRKIRYIDERPFLNLSQAKFFNLQLCKAGFISILSKRYQNRLRREGFTIVDQFFGVSISGSMTLACVENFLLKLNNGICEFMCHPGLPETDGETIAEQGKYFITKSRPIELKILLNEKLKEIIHQRQIRLIHYGEI